MRKLKYDIAIIGAGAFTGFFASFLNEAGAAGKYRVVAVEKLPRPFKKIAAAGNGRCNYSNEKFSPGDYISLEPDPAFERTVFDSISSLDLKKFFGDHLVPSRSDEYGRLFPFTNSSKTIVEFLEHNLKHSGIETLCDTLCDETEPAAGGSGFSIGCVNSKTGEQTSIYSNILIFACGGAAYPQLGSGGASFELIKKFGHRIAGPVPGICALETAEKPFAKLAGIKMEARLKYKDFDRTGEILFTDYGISGPNVLYLSSLVTRDLFLGEKPLVTIDFLPAAQLSAKYFLEGSAAGRFNSPADIFGGALNRDFLKAFIRAAGMDRLNSDAALIKRLHGALKNYTAKILRARPFTEAQVSLGGVRCAEITPDTLESKFVKNIFFAGEVIDYTGGCGGYNIHFAAACARSLVKRLFIK
jgi:predicted Rossmann fold flavoprotein